ncbi:MAG: DNA-binding transcriptional regulator [Succiniclasticum sp.]|jgi:central glycolytic genes regulator|nr:DNA-binding transcriptional regulator [Succiniclasticum sp.]MDY2870894.1 sugar-binding domain-containing protein [Succiniclasticum sp.]MDY6346721.1 sugar-binding domain-containing protein [Succiniclasticum sp.]
MVDNLVNLQKKIVPEMTDLLIERYRILRQVSNEQPIGRRALAGRLDLSERVLRSQVDFLKGCGLLTYSTAGMSVTEEGNEILRELADYVRKLQGISSLEQFLLEHLSTQRVIIIPGDCDKEEVVKREIGRAAAHTLVSLLEAGKGRVVAVSGGTTLAAAAQNIRGNFPDVVIVPARGGLGDMLELQANTVSTVMARNLKASYRQLYVPDSVSQEILNSILAEDAGIRAVVDTIKHADILVHGIGRADVMARHRHLPQPLIDSLLAQGAVGEAVGQYNDIKGRQVYMTNNAGLMMQDLPRIGTIIGVAGGKSKARAILAVSRATRQDILITDEAAATEMAAVLEREEGNTAYFNPF